MLDRLYRINQGLDRRFPTGRDPFQIITRLAEECGELAREVNHFEGSGVKADKHGPPDRHALAKEIRDVLLCALQIAAYYGVESDPDAIIDNSIQRLRAEGLLDD